MNPLSIPCCPFCDNAIEEIHEHKIVVQHGSKFLAHAECEDEED
jgi:hypothetical protein